MSIRLKVTDNCTLEFATIVQAEQFIERNRCYYVFLGIESKLLNQLEEIIKKENGDEESNQSE